MHASSAITSISKRLSQVAIPFDTLQDMPMDGLMRRIGNARVVMIGEASHGTSEFYAARARITRQLIERLHFDFVAIEGDWPDASRVDHYVRDRRTPSSEWTAFARFPTWMWRNDEVRLFVDWLRRWNLDRPEPGRVGFHGLDLYSLYLSLDEVLAYLRRHEPDLAKQALASYQCLLPYRDDPVNYARTALNPRFRSCEDNILATLANLYQHRRELARHDGESLFDALQNANLVASAEEYYRTMFFSDANAWNLRDTHMFSTLERLLEHYGENSRGIVWAHNSHVGDSDATDMGRRGEYNIGRLARARYGDDLFSIGFGTHQGTVMAASDWGGEAEVKSVNPSLADSYELAFHGSGVERALVPLRHGDGELLHLLRPKRLQRAIGVIYRPETERHSHYYHASLPQQFDEYIWFNETRAVTPLKAQTLQGVPDTYPFGL